MTAQYVVAISKDLMGRGAGLILKRVGITVIRQLSPDELITTSFGEMVGTPELWLVEDQMADKSYEGKRVQLIMAVDNGTPVLSKREIL